MTARVSSREAKRLREIAKDYENTGYKVLLSPKQGDVPSFLAGLHPDMVAYGENGNVVVEVKNMSSVRSNDRMVALARALESHPGWRLDFVTLGDGTLLDLPDGARSLHLEETRSVVASAKHLLTIGQVDAGILLGWSAIEALMRLNATQNKIKSPPVSPASLARELYIVGLLSLEQYQFLREAISVRNAVAHGYWHGPPKRALGERLVEMSGEMLNSFFAVGK